MDRSSIEVGAVPFISTSVSNATRWIIDSARCGNPAAVRLPNSYSVALASQDPGYRSVLTGEGINLPDGAPVAWIMRRTNRALESHQVRGPSLFASVLEAGCVDGVRHFFLGGTPEMLADLQLEVQKRFPEIEVAGAYAPPFGPLDETFYENSLDRIRAASPQIVWVGLGTPKQDYAGVELTRRSGITTVAVGAAFDFMAGTAREAPAWLQGTGFEWTFRLVTEPKRLWKRYLIGNFQFLNVAVRHMLNSKEMLHER